jgi:dCMP deaminase
MATELSWKEYFWHIAQQIKNKSKDKRTQIGCVVVGQNNEIVSTGYNSFPRGIDDNRPERQERPEKYYWFSHAETNAIINAALIGVSTKGCTMYMTCGIPCADCARNIINSGIVRIVCSPGDGATGHKWEEHELRSRQMFEESGIKIEYY